jgi:hypothetical protein
MVSGIRAVNDWVSVVKTPVDLSCEVEVIVPGVKEVLATSKHDDSDDGTIAVVPVEVADSAQLVEVRGVGNT